MCVNGDLPDDAPVCRLVTVWPPAQSVRKMWTWTLRRPPAGLASAQPVPGTSTPRHDLVWPPPGLLLLELTTVYMIVTGRPTYTSKFAIYVVMFLF